MEVRIEYIEERKLVGTRIKTSTTRDLTGKLWSDFMPKRKEISNNVSSDLFSLQQYDAFYFEKFDPNRQFEKWALVEVKDFINIPKEMEAFVLKEGKYAVFLYKGSINDKSIFEFIFTSWLPSSNYQLDNRPHFEILGGKYMNNDANSEEEIWIPIIDK